MVHWCTQNHLELNLLKTAGITVDFRENPPTPAPLTILNITVSNVGTTISRDLKWSPHIDSVRKKAHERLYVLRHLRKFNLPQELLITFQTSMIQSMLCTSITTWFRSATKLDRHRTIRSAEKIIGVSLPSSRTCACPRSGSGRMTYIQTPHTPHINFLNSPCLVGTTEHCTPKPPDIFAHNCTYLHYLSL